GRDRRSLEGVQHDRLRPGGEVRRGRGQAGHDAFDPEDCADTGPDQETVTPGCGREDAVARSKTPNRGKGQPRRSSGAPGTFTLAQVAAAVGGRVHRASRRRLSGVAPLEAAGPGDLSWVADQRRSTEAAMSRAGALL